VSAHKQRNEIKIKLKKKQQVYSACFDRSCHTVKIKKLLNPYVFAVQYGNIQLK